MIKEKSIGDLLLIVGKPPGLPHWRMGKHLLYENDILIVVDYILYTNGMTVLAGNVIGECSLGWLENNTVKIG